MKDHAWLAVFSIFTLIVGALFTYGSATRADTDPPPIQVSVTSTTTSPMPVIIQESSRGEELPSPTIIVNVMIATSSFASAPQPSLPMSAKEKPSSQTTYYVTNNTSYAAAKTETATSTEKAAASISLAIQGVRDATTTPIEDGETLLELLKRLDAIAPDLDLITEDYGDMGVLVTGMGGRANGTDGSYWQYQVDGVTPMVGADQYELKDGEIIIWEFKGF